MSPLAKINSALMLAGCTGSVELTPDGYTVEIWSKATHTSIPEVMDRLECAGYSVARDNDTLYIR
jgi:hypothetical protein